LFRATSAVCVTGLIVHDTAAYFTTAGQIINIVLVQLGGLGIMTFSTLILLVAGKRISIKDRIIIQQGFHYARPKDLKSLVKHIFLYTFTIETVGALFFFIGWPSGYPLLKRIYFSLFHSVSAFCNAGFALFSDSFEAFKGDILINLTLIVLIILGGLGFLVLEEIRGVFSGFFRRKKTPISLHTKLVLIMTAVLIGAPAVLFFLIEIHHGFRACPLRGQLFCSLFQVVTARTAGFNSMPLATLSHPSVFLLILLMFIGASPGSTGGGVKVTTSGVIFSFMKSRISARESVNLFRRTLPLDLITKAFAVVTLSMGVIFLSSFVVLMAQPELTMREVFFEIFSAFGTVGMSMGVTAKLSTLSKLIVIATMYIGRIGPLTLLFAFSRRRAYGRFSYAEETVMIG